MKVHFVNLKYFNFIIEYQCTCQIWTAGVKLKYKTLKHYQHHSTFNHFLHESFNLMFPFEHTSYLRIEVAIDFSLCASVTHWLGSAHL